jgi:hypothetical protein
MLPANMIDLFAHPTHFNHEDGGCMFLRNTGILLQVHTVCRWHLSSQIHKTVKYGYESRWARNQEWLFTRPTLQASTLKMDAVCSSETLIFTYKITRCRSGNVHRPKRLRPRLECCQGWARFLNYVAVSFPARHSLRSSPIRKFVTSFSHHVLVWSAVLSECYSSFIFIYLQA